MPEPPDQTDMRTQGLPPRRPNVVTGFVQGSPAVLLITHPRQLPAALKQNEKPVVIENTQANARLIRDFKRLLQADRLLIVGLIIVVIMQMVITIQA